MASILVVDDDADERRKIADGLTAAGHMALEAESGNGALGLFRIHAPELVITEIVMPDKDGLELISELRRRNFGGPIIAISGGDPARRAVYLRLARMMGADESLVRPFSTSELTDAIERLLHAREHP